MAEKPSLYMKFSIEMIQRSRKFKPLGKSDIAWLIGWDYQLLLRSTRITMIQIVVITRHWRISSNFCVKCDKHPANYGAIFELSDY